MYHTYGINNKVGYAAGLKDKTSATTAKFGLKSKVWMEDQAHNAGRLHYRIGREKTDPGTEFKGEYYDRNLSNGVGQTVGEVDRHECNASIENENRWVVIEAAAMSIEGTSNDEQCAAVASEAIMAVRQVLNHAVRGKTQKEAGMSEIELLRRKPGLSDKWNNDRPKFLSLVYGLIKKKDRRGKTCRRAFQALYGSEDLDMDSGHRLIPYERQGEDIVFYPTIARKSCRFIKDNMPLVEIGCELELEEEMVEASDVATAAGAEIDNEDELAEADSADTDDDEDDTDDEHWAEEDYEVETIMDKLIHDDDRVEYKVKFRNYDEPEWIEESKLEGCKKLVREYEAVVAIRELDGCSKTKGRKIVAAVELNILAELAGNNPKGVIKAIEREGKQMLARRLRKLSDNEVAALSDDERRKANKLRHLLTRKRPKLEQQQEKELEGGSYKGIES